MCKVFVGSKSVKNLSLTRAKTFRKVEKYFFTLKAIWQERTFPEWTSSKIENVKNEMTKKWFGWSVLNQSVYLSTYRANLGSSQWGITRPLPNVLKDSKVGTLEALCSNWICLFPN